MANLEKHKKNLFREWLDEEETVTAQGRSSRLLGPSGKIPKVAGKRASSLPMPAPQKPDPALVREAAPPARLNEKHSQASSPEHLRKLQRLPKLRAPITYPVPQKAAVVSPAPKAAVRPSGNPPRTRPQKGRIL